MDVRVKLICLSRNFGHEAAMIAGLDYSRGDGIVCMDADLQHPPECLPEIVRCFEEGWQVINMVRTKNRDAGLVKNLTSAAFYHLINAISDVHFEPNASDFFAVDRFAFCGVMSRMWALKKQRLPMKPGQGLPGRANTV